MGEPLIQARSIIAKSRAGADSSLAGKGAARVILNQVDLTVEQGAGVGLVGESGSGRATLARILAGLIPFDEGSVEWLGKDIVGLGRAEWKDYRRAIQFVFRDPLKSMNPRQTLGVMLATPMRALTGRDKKARAFHAEEVLDRVGLSSEILDWYPYQLSGGQLRQVAIARALAPDPDLLILDERMARMDLSVQVRQLKLLTRIQHDLGLAYLVISDNLPIVERLCDQVTVLKAGCIVEQGSCAEVLNRPGDDYTRQLCAAVPRLPVE